MSDIEYFYEDDEKKMNNFSILKQNDNLFDDNDYVAHQLLTVKRVNLPGNEEEWEVINNNRIVFILPGARLTKKEKNVMRTVVGFRILINEFKSGNRSINKIKNILKKAIKND